MPIELPPDVDELRARIARASLDNSFRQAFSEEPPDYIMDSTHQIERAKREWCEHYASEVALLAGAAQSALRYFEHDGHRTAIGAFTSSVMTQPALDDFMHANVYLEELVAGTLRDRDAFRTLLALFVQLGEPCSA